MVEAEVATAPPPARERPVPMPPRTTYHRVRKTVHWLCFACFVLLPFFDVMRFDIPRQRFYFAGNELWINEFAIIFFALMFLLFVVVAVSMLYGRLYCSYLCPQMIFSEASLWVESRLLRWINRKFISWPTTRRKVLQRTLFFAALVPPSVFLAFVFIAYFVEPRDLLHRLLSLDLRTAGGISGATVTLITFLDFTLVRQSFCRTVCPYGYLQGMLADGETLLVHYRDPGQDCIECKKCVRICHMGIDIRNSPYQIECVHCAECIDACDDVLGRLGKPGLIHYTWGECGETLERRDTWYRRIGLRDAKRVVVLLVILFYASGLAAALALRKPVLVQISPDRGDALYRVRPDGTIANRFRVRVANRSRKQAAVIVSMQDLPGAALSLDVNPIPVGPGESVERYMEVVAPRAKGSQEVNHFLIFTRSIPDQDVQVMPQTFLIPREEKTP